MYYTEPTGDKPSYHKYINDISASTVQYFEIKSTNDVSQ